MAFCGAWAVTGGTEAGVYAKLKHGILLAIMELERAANAHRRFSVQAANGIDLARSSIYGE